MGILGEFFYYTRNFCIIVVTSSLKGKDFAEGFLISKILFRKFFRNYNGKRLCQRCFGIAFRQTKRKNIEEVFIGI